MVIVIIKTVISMFNVILASCFLGMAMKNKGKNQATYVGMISLLIWVIDNTILIWL